MGDAESRATNLGQEKMVGRVAAQNFVMSVSDPQLRIVQPGARTVQARENRRRRSRAQAPIQNPASQNRRGSGDATGAAVTVTVTGTSMKLPYARTRSGGKM